MDDPPASPSLISFRYTWTVRVNERQLSDEESVSLLLFDFVLFWLQKQQLQKSIMLRSTLSGQSELGWVSPFLEEEYKIEGYNACTILVAVLEKYYPVNFHKLTLSYVWEWQGCRVRKGHARNCIRHVAPYRLHMNNGLITREPMLEYMSIPLSQGDRIAMRWLEFPDFSVFCTSLRRSRPCTITSPSSGIYGYMGRMERWGLPATQIGDSGKTFSSKVIPCDTVRTER